jgi:zinc transport system substrate-binding protein
MPVIGVARATRAMDAAHFPESTAAMLKASRAGLILCAALVGTWMTIPLAAAAEIKVVATIKPIHALVAKVMQGVGTPALLISGAASPHTYAMKPSDVRALHAADIFFRVLETVEPFTAKVIASLPGSVRVATLADAPGIELLDVRTGATFEAHRHDDHGKEHGATGLAHKDDDHDENARARRDGHVWLDPENAKMMVAEIARVLAEASPENADVFRENADRLVAEIGALEAQIADELAPVKGRPFVVFHDAYQYFERRYGLNALGSITVSPEIQPSAKRLGEIRRKIAALGAACVFAEPQFQPKLVDAVIEGTNARSGTLDPEGALVAPGPDAYAVLLKSLAAGLRSCLIQGS